MRYLVLLMISAASYGAVVTEDGEFILYRSGRPQSPTYVTYDGCRAALESRAKAESKTSGYLTFACRQNVTARYSAITVPPPVCPPLPPPTTRTATCPAPTVGTWQQDLKYTSAPPDCATAWLPEEAAGICAAPPVEPPVTAININAGGPAISNYVADRYFVNGTATSNCPLGLTGIFQTHRYTTGVNVPLQYRVPLANGRYTIRLLLRECTHTSAGQRVMRANINGVLVEPFDSYSSDNAVVMRERVVEVTNGFADLSVTSVAGNAMLSGIDVIPGGTVPPIEPPVIEPPPPATAGTAALSWVIPTQRTDGSAYTNPKGYSIHYGQTAGELSGTVGLVVPSQTTYVVTGLTPGTWLFCLKSLALDGGESACSNVASKSVQ